MTEIAESLYPYEGQEEIAKVESSSKQWTSSVQANVVSLALRERDRSDNKTVNRDLRKGLVKHTEHYAYSHVIPLAENPRDEERLLRIAGLVSTYPVAQGEQSFGSWLYGKKSKSVEDRLSRIVSLSFEQAVSEFSRILKMVGNEGSFNWYRLADTLFFWGNGITDMSLKSRQKTLREYYRAEGIDAKLTNKNDEKSSEKGVEDE